MFGNRHFAIVVTRENRLRFALMQREHGLLHDVPEKKSYAVIAEPYPTNWAGKWARAYLVYEAHAQTTHVEARLSPAAEPGDAGTGAPEVVAEAPGASPGAAAPAAPACGATVTIEPPLAMVAKKRLPGPRGEDGHDAEVTLTGESIFDRTMAVQVRRLGNRRIQWFHALLFVSLGIAIALALVAAIVMFSGGGGAPPAPPVGGASGGPTVVSLG